MTNASGTKQAAPQTMRLICCAINEEEFCLEMASVLSLGRTKQLGFHSALKGLETPAGAIGWITVQRQHFPVFDLGERLHRPSSSASNPQHEGFTMLINAAEPFGLRVDRIVGNLEVSLSQIVPLPHIIEPGVEKRFKGVVKLEDKWLLCVDGGTLRRLLPGRILPVNQASRAMMSAPANTPAPHHKTAQVMLFSSAQSLHESGEAQPMVFGLSLTQVQEISNLMPILPIPSAPHYVFGVTNWRDLPIPIIDLQARLGLSQTPVSPNQIDPKSRLLIARAPSGWLGVPIHPQVKAFPLPIPYQPNQQSLSLERELVLGIFDLEGSPLVIPDLEAMLTRRFAPQGL
jgi:chemotaxis signal transduction protein